MLVGEASLTVAARRTIENASSLSISSISFFEMGQKVRIGKWPEMAPFLGDLTRIANEQGIELSAMPADVALFAAQLDWDHRDPFDRIIAATAIISGRALISADTAFDTLPDARLERLW